METAIEEQIETQVGTIEVRWGTSRGRDSYGYTLCTLWLDGRKVARTCGGGYDLRGTVLGDWLARTYADRLLKLTEPFHGLTFHDPDYDPSKAIIGTDCQNRTIGGPDGKTVEQAEADGSSLGLERYQAFYRASSKTPTKQHRMPLIDGACGESSVARIANAIGIGWRRLGAYRSNARTELYAVVDNRGAF